MVAAWPFYLTGTVVIFVGFVALHRWVLGMTGRRADAPRSVLTGAFLAFLLGAGSVALAITLDTDQVHSRIFAYRVAVDLNGTEPVRLLLPAPVDVRLHAALNRGSGNSTIRIVQVDGMPLVELLAGGDVAFDVRVSVVDAPFNRTLTRTSSASNGTANATVELVPSGDTLEASLDLRIEFDDFCDSVSYAATAVVRSGATQVPFLTTYALC